MCVGWASPGFSKFWTIHKNSDAKESLLSGRKNKSSTIFYKIKNPSNFVSAIEKILLKEKLSLSMFVLSMFRWPSSGHVFELNPRPNSIRLSDCIFICSLLPIALCANFHVEPEFRLRFSWKNNFHVCKFKLFFLKTMRCFLEKKTLNNFHGFNEMFFERNYQF